MFGVIVKLDNQAATIAATAISTAHRNVPPAEDEPIVENDATNAGCHETKGWQYCHNGRKMDGTISN
jgi:hypothetical protein